MMKPEIPKPLQEAWLASGSVTTDSRNIRPNDIFFALRGDSFDGNRFAKEAVAQGALLAVVDDPSLADQPGCLPVDDVLTCLQNLARWHRSKLSIPVIGITGSNGKTTTKELISAVLSQTYNCVATRGNLNNHIGVPLTVLSIKPEHTIAVVEMGANHVGEIAALSKIAMPTHACITNIGKAHLEGFGGLEGVKRAKRELYDYIHETSGHLFVPADNELLMQFSEGCSRTTYGSDKNADIRALITSTAPFLNVKYKEHLIETKLTGGYNFDNLMAAIAMGVYFNTNEISIVKALREYTPTNNRSQFCETNRNSIIKDAYNANPSSMEAALQNLESISHPRKIAILGDMLELGDESISEHTRILDLAMSLALEKLIVIGPQFRIVSEGKSLNCFANSEEAALWLNKQELKNALILVKGSRGIKLEKVYEEL